MTDIHVKNKYSNGLLTFKPFDIINFQLLYVSLSPWSFVKHKDQYNNVKKKNVIIIFVFSLIISKLWK
jgi:hypothetical protein